VRIPKDRITSFLVPPLLVGTLLYQVLSDLQISVIHGPTLSVLALAIGVALAGGALAALAPAPIRIAVLALFTLLFLDVTFHLGGAFADLTPKMRERLDRDTRRIEDLKAIQVALDRYASEVGPLPMPAEYREGVGTPSWWGGWWDVSSDSGFLDFLVEDGILEEVPRDPANVAARDGGPRGGQQYVYFLVPAEYDYAGGACEPSRWHYLIAATDLEEEPSRPPRRFEGSGCECLWRDAPDFFEHHFDYILCGSFETTPEALEFAANRRVARAAEIAAREKAEAAAAIARIEAEKLKHFIPKDQQRIADLVAIRNAFEEYLRKVGPLPRPSEYGEAERSEGTSFWHRYWDVSSEDGDGDGRPFLDFLFDGGIMRKVPLDPDNIRGERGDPRGGKQYVYFLLPPGSDYAGGPANAGSDRWHYLLAITDLESEPARPPMNFQGSGCAELWKNAPNFFQDHFDYVLCGSFKATPEARARAADARARIEAERDTKARERIQAADARRIAAETARRATELRKLIPKDQRRVDDLHRIREALEAYIATTGPLPPPVSYGEAESSPTPGFWHRYWDLSAEDGDGDGRPFLQFLLDSNVMEAVPVDPDNIAPESGDPRGGRQYVYFLLPPGSDYAGGPASAAPGRWHYMLAITDLESELSRPPQNFAGSGCEDLWRDASNFFQAHFDYVLCGNFDVPPLDELPEPSSDQEAPPVNREKEADADR
jgi:hypothetical protein